MKIYTKEIEHCQDCPSHLYHKSWEDARCGQLKEKIIPDTVYGINGTGTKFPEWCPLKDVLKVGV